MAESRMIDSTLDWSTSTAGVPSRSLLSINMTGNIVAEGLRGRTRNNLQWFIGVQVRDAHLYYSLFITSVSVEYFPSALYD
jgi:hypothetical protein